MALETTISKPAGGGSLAYSTGKEIYVSATSTLSAATNGAKPHVFNMSADGQVVTMYSGAALATKNRTIGYMVAPQSKPFIVVDQSNRLVAILFPGAVGRLYASALTSAADWVVIGSTGSEHRIWARNAPAMVDLGSTTAPNSALIMAANKVAWVSATCFVFTYEYSSNIYAVVCTVNATTKAVTAGSAQTVRDTANTMTGPACCGLMTAGALDGRVAFTWYESTTPKLEGAVATVDETARTISLGSVVDIKAATTIDATAGCQGMTADAGTTGAFWFINNYGSGVVLTYATTSGTTLTINANNIQVSSTTQTASQICSPATDKCVLVGKDSDSTAALAQYQLSAGSLALEWTVKNPGMSNFAGTEVLVPLSSTQAFVSAADFHYNVTFSTGGTVNWQRMGETTLSDTSGANQVFGYSGIGIDDRTVLRLPGTSDSNSYSTWNLNETVYMSATVLLPFNRRPRLNLNRTRASLYTTGIGVHPTTKDIALIRASKTTAGSNYFFDVNVYEVARN